MESKECRESNELICFSLNTRGQLVYAYGDRYAYPVSSLHYPAKDNYSLCPIGVDFAFVPVWVVKEQIDQLRKGLFSQYNQNASYSVLVPHPVDTSNFKEHLSKVFCFFKYEGENISLTACGDRNFFYSQTQAEALMGTASLIEVDVCGEIQKYYVSEASKLIAEAFKYQRWCVRMIGVPAT